MNNDSIMSEHMFVYVRSSVSVARGKIEKKNKKRIYVKHKTLKKKRLCADIACDNAPYRRRQTPEISPTRFLLPVLSFFLSFSLSF